jgi:hypothetical protein
MKLLPLGAKLFQVDEGRTDRHDGDISRFSQFYERACKSLLPFRYMQM